MKRVNCFQVFKIMKLLMLFLIKKKFFLSHRHRLVSLANIIGSKICEALLKHLTLTGWRSLSYRNHSID